MALALPIQGFVDLGRQPCDQRSIFRAALLTEWCMPVLPTLQRRLGICEIAAEQTEILALQGEFFDGPASVGKTPDSGEHTSMHRNGLCYISHLSPSPQAWEYVTVSNAIKWRMASTSA
jgi:hypothetical protein